jgi:Rps23 Pro-64 3,4-dihydroxylase Tpa1-like proline 4-hydroxylase
MQLNNIKIKDNLLSKQDIKNIYDFCKNQTFSRTETDDNNNVIHTGLVCDLDKNEGVVNFLLKATNTSKDKLIRSYINLFLPNEQAYFHQDKQNNEKTTTILYYVNNEPSNLNDLGETFFYINNEIRGIQPVPGRIIIFNGDIWHRASCLRNTDRFTIALKMKG